MGLPDNGVRGLCASPAQWLEAKGPQADLVLSSRVRLARNLAGHPFPGRSKEELRERILDLIKPAAQATHYLANAAFFVLSDLSTLEQQALVERRLASPDLLREDRGSGLLVGSDQSLSLMINEEDHIRLSSLFSGLDLVETFRVADQVDDRLQEQMDFAYSEEWGFLTACPTNVGTGLRASMLLHLPALVLTQRIDAELKNLSSQGMAVRGFYGESSQVSGHLFQIGNRTSLGSTELEIIENVERAGRHLLESEFQAREYLMAQARQETEDKIWRALGILENARVLTSEEFLSLSSAIRMGISMKILKRPSLEDLNRLMVMIQPANLQLYADREMEPRERDIWRAELVREKLKKSD